jgi:hypothetical protein
LGMLNNKISDSITKKFQQSTGFRAILQVCLIVIVLYFILENVDWMAHYPFLPHWESHHVGVVFIPFFFASQENIDEVILYFAHKGE